MKSPIGVVLFLLVHYCSSSPQGPEDPCEGLGNNYDCILAAATDWAAAKKDIEQLTSGLIKYTEPMTTVVRAVLAIETETSVYASAIEKAAAAIAAIPTAHPETDKVAKEALVAVESFLSGDLGAVMRTVNEKAYAVAKWIPAHEWDKTIRNPLESILGVLKDAVSPVLDTDTRGQAVKMLTKYCEKSDPTRAIEYLWSLITEGCPLHKTQAAPYSLENPETYAEPDAKRDRCLPEELMEHEGFTTNAAAKFVELIDGILATTGFALASCLSTAFSATQNAQIQRFNETLTEIQSYTSSNLLDLATRYFPDNVYSVVNKTMKGANGRTRSEKVISVLSQLDETYRDFRHSAVTFRWDERVDHVGQVFAVQLPECAGGQYSRSNYKGGNEVYAFDGWAYVFNRIPADPQCAEQIAKEYREWKQTLERVEGKSLQELWDRLVGECTDRCEDEEGLNRLLDTVKDDWQFGNNTGYSSVHIGCYETARVENVAWPPTAMDSYRKQCEDFEYSLQFVM